MRMSEVERKRDIRQSERASEREREDDRESEDYRQRERGGGLTERDKTLRERRRESAREIREV